MGYSQAQLAQAIGVARTTVVAWERGQSQAPKWFDLAASAVVRGIETYEPSPKAVRMAHRCLRLDPRWHQPLYEGNDNTAPLPFDGEGQADG